VNTADIAIRVTNLSKCYQIYDKPNDRLKQFVLPRLQRLLGRKPKQYFQQFWALKGVSFEVKKGETVGIIGRNGSGKSTLLQMICGTLTPTSGNIQTNGRIAALLELGSGFNPEFTGRENVYINAAILGLSNEEIDERFGAIVDFADIGQFIEQPVKTYSSGMMVRLAFAVQCQVSPDILIVDEALAVGDAKFQAKCFDRLRQLKENGTSILLVTHSSEQIVTHCSSAILLNDGLQIEIGVPRNIVNSYMDILFGKENNQIKLESSTENKAGDSDVINQYHLSADEESFKQRIGYNLHEYRWGDGKASILDFYISVDGDPYPAYVKSGQLIKLVVLSKFNETLIRPIFGVTLKTKEGVTIYGVNSEILSDNNFKHFGDAQSFVTTEFNFDCSLAAGDYFLSLGIATKIGEEIIPHDRRYDSIHIQVTSGMDFFGLIDLKFKMNTCLAK
jgi:lipopolysaccharide transport system ATP-binding protein